MTSGRPVVLMTDATIAAIYSAIHYYVFVDVLKKDSAEGVTIYLKLSVHKNMV